jgi:hypothetical protein
LLLQDTHTLNFSEFRTANVNITLLRLVDPEDSTVKLVVKLWTEKEELQHRTLGVTADTLRVSMGQA